MSEAGSDTAALRYSPLDAEHRDLGARMAAFGGWEMPIQYTSVLEEHRACREHAVAFDVSHLGSVRVAGPGAFGLLQWAFTNDLARIEPGRAQYTHLLDRGRHVEPGGDRGPGPCCAGRARRAADAMGRGSPVRRAGGRLRRRAGLG